MDTGGDQKQHALKARYRSLMPIGEGGMGRVEVALERGDGGFERVVALKRMRAEVAKDPRHTEMFLREARLAALLSHPNVVHTFAFGESEGELFLAMEYVEGETLTAILERSKRRKKPLDPAIGLEILEHVCEALHAAHELKDLQGNPLSLVHRDITPSNVMVSYDGHVKLLDFGVAKIDAKTGLTRAGEVKGKMAYMAPEQAMGDPVDRRSDLYAVGSLLYEVMSGEPMWGDVSELEIMRRMATSEAPKLRDAPSDICMLQQKLVHKSPENRPNNAREVAAALRAAKASDQDLAAVMRDLFADDARDKRDALLAAMQRGEDQPNVKPAVESVDAPPATLAPLVKTSSRSALWATAAGVVVAVGVIGALAFRPSRAPGNDQVTPDSGRSLEAVKAPPPSALLSATALSTPTPSPSAQVTKVSPAISRPIVPSTAKPASSAPLPRASSSSSPSVDVDPNPI